MDDQSGIKTGRYVLDDQIGYRLRLANQRHLEIFNRLMPDLTPTQFSVLVRLSEVGEVSQNHLGRMVATDAATTKGVVSRLAKKGFVKTLPSQTDRRRLLISLTEAGAKLTAQMIVKAQEITSQTCTRLNAVERKRLMDLLEKL